MELTIEIVNNCKERGLSCSEVAEEVNCTVSAVYNFCRRNGIKLKKKHCGGHNFTDLKGRKLGALEVIKRAGSKRNLAAWECKCPCGKLFIALGTDITHRKTRTCGCRTGIESRRNWQGYGEIPKSYWRVLNGNAKQKQRELNITIEYLNDLFLLQGRRCALSGIEISFKNNTASLDRIDNQKGYIKGNVQWVHKDINNMKHTFENSYFVNLCQRVSEQQRRNK